MVYSKITSYLRFILKRIIWKTGDSLWKDKLIWEKYTRLMTLAIFDHSQLFCKDDSYQSCHLVLGAIIGCGIIYK